MKNLIKIVLTSALLLTACSKDDLICGEITGGGVDRFTGLLYLTVDDTKIWVDDKTYTSYYVGDYECFENY